MTKPDPDRLALTILVLAAIFSAGLVAAACFALWSHP